MQFTDKIGPKTENDVSMLTVAIGEINPFATGEYAKAQEEALKYIQSLDGFVGFHPVLGRGTLCLFSSEKQAKVARKKIKAKGCPVGDNVGECYVPKADLKMMKGVKN